jgi:hypothetical protein|tara:strand:+ start:1286 stop:1822 length:537 start_codon:yes stop_codon:yes gene_type:complete
VKTDNIERYLESFGKQVVAQAKTTLNYKKGGDSKLEESIKFEVVTTPDGFTVQFYMSSYGQFVDKGVSGTQTERTFKDYKGKVIKTPYSYKNSKGHSQPPSKALDKWVVRKGIAPRDASGKFMSRKSITFLIARSIGRKGIQGISFFQKPLGLGLKQFGKDLLGNVKEDIINSITTIK